MRALIAAAALLSLTACPLPQPGCTLENCQLMVQACRVEFPGGPADLAICTGYDRPPGPVDYAKYCVAACNAHPGNGAMASCIAARADACRDAGTNYTRLDQIVTECADPAARGPEPSCEARCTAERNTCDDACSGGKPCDDCIRAGRGTACAPYCTDAGYAACLDCSSGCGVRYVQCTDACPRVP